MKTKTLTLTAITAIAAGVALIIANKSIYSDGVVIAGGIIFIVSGILNSFVFSYEKKHDQKGRGAFASIFSLLTSIGAVVLGVCMLIFKDTFTALVPYIFGIIVAFLAIYQFYVLAIGVRPATLPGWFYVVPVILLAGAVYIFTRRPHDEDSLIMLSSGIALCLFGLATVAEASLLPHLRKKVAEADTARSEGSSTEAGEEKKPLSPKPLDDSEDAAAQ